MTSDVWQNRIVGEGEVAAGELVAHPQNWRKHPKEQAKQLAGTLGGVGWVQRVIVNRRTGRMLDGHLRAELARTQGEATPVPVVYVDLSEDEERTVLATLDPIAGMAIADEATLAGLVRSIEDADLRSIAGSMAQTLKVDVDGTGEAGRDTEAQVDRAEELRQKWGVEPGQLWQLGEHRLICGDCTDAAVVARVMAGEKAQLMATDPPYAIYGSSTGIGSDIADDKMVRPFFLEILRLAEHLDMFSHMYICCDWRSWPSWWEMAKRANVTPKNLIVWDKGGAGLGSSYANAYELVGFFARLPKQTVMTSDMKRGQRMVHQSNIWRGGRVQNRDHNAQKPTELMQWLIENSTDDGASVLEPFSGSGTTLIACENLGRRCRAVEIAPGYVAVALERWATHTGKVPVLVEAGG